MPRRRHATAAPAAARPPDHPVLLVCETCRARGLLTGWRHENPPGGLVHCPACRAAGALVAMRVEEIHA
jgi:hypothetical protein